MLDSAVDLLFCHNELGRDCNHKLTAAIADRITSETILGEWANKVSTKNNPDTVDAESVLVAIALRSQFELAIGVLLDAICHSIECALHIDVKVRTVLSDEGLEGSECWLFHNVVGSLSYKGILPYLGPLYTTFYVESEKDFTLLTTNHLREDPDI